MALIRITSEKFDRYNVQRYPTGSYTEEYWFADDVNNLLGIVVRDNIDKNWSFVILAPNEFNEYVFEEAIVDIDSPDDAISALTKRVAEIGKSGKIESSIYESNLFDPKSSIIISTIDEEVKRYFRQHPERLYEINPRKFEELIADIFKDLGFDVELTKATRDGGRDIIASLRNSVTSFLSYIECKRYSPENKVDVSIIRQVQGVHYTRQPNKSIIVTTSFFTKDAVEEARLIENALDLKDFNDIKGWLQKY